MRSMTGYGAGAAALGARRVAVEVRSVNHRYLDLRVQLPEELLAHQNAVEAATRARLERGRYDLRARLDEPEAAEVELDEARARSAFEALGRLRDAIAPSAELPLSLLVAVPDLFRPASGPDAATVRSALVQAAEEALDDLDRMRGREGESLARELGRLFTRLREHAAFIRERSEGVPERERDRLQQRVAQLATDVDPDRLALEVALLADKCDITEELARLDSHSSQGEAMLESSEPIGRKLDFLLQEMGREVNTMGAKSPDAAIAQRVVELKADIERLRQQAQNVE